MSAGHKNFPSELIRGVRSLPVKTVYSGTPRCPSRPKAGLAQVMMKMMMML